MRLLLIGANGQLGQDLRKALSRKGHELFTPRHAELDICDSAAITQAIASLHPDAVFNAAAFHKVEECGQDPLLAFDVNSLAVWNLARACEQSGSYLIHFSTDYVFDGATTRPYCEVDLPGPINVYGTSKLAGEYLIKSTSARHLIIRTSGLYGLAGSSGKGGNFVKNMLKRAASGSIVRVVNDQVLTPTHTVDLANAVITMVEQQLVGLYHVTSEGECSWYAFTEEIFRLRRLSVNLVPVSTADFPSPVRRPPYSVLGKEKLRAAGVVMPQWENALAEYLNTEADLALG